MNTDQLLSEDDMTWITSYQAQVITTLTSRFRESGDRFARWQPLINRFSAAVETVLCQGRSKFRAVDEAHNELCIAQAILSNPARGSIASSTSRHYAVHPNPSTSGQLPNRT